MLSVQLYTWIQPSSVPSHMVDWARSISSDNEDVDEVAANVGPADDCTSCSWDNSLVTVVMAGCAVFN